jgi:hypothetical protein
MYLLQRKGPTSFTLKETEEGVQYYVNIGLHNSCSCIKKSIEKEPDLCSHILFVLVKILRLSPSNPLVWQLSLLGVTIVALYCLIQELFTVVGVHRDIFCQGSASAHPSTGTDISQWIPSSI